MQQEILQTLTTFYVSSLTPSIIDLPKQFQCLADQTLRYFGEYTFRCSRPELIYKMASKKVYKMFMAKPVSESFLNKVTGPLLATLLKRRLRHRCCPDNFAKFSRIPVLWNTCKQLLFYIARLVSTWKKVSSYAIYCWFIWFNYARSMKTKEMLSISSQIRCNFWQLSIHKALLVVSRVITMLLPVQTVSVTIMYPAFLYYSKHLPQFEHKSSDRNG